MTETPPVLTPAAFAERLAQAASGGRLMAALAGAPGSGKSTVAAEIAARLDNDAPGLCVTIPMDGFHLDDRILESRGWRARKGAPHTFDVGGLASLLDRLRANAEAEIAFPLFDRSLELSRAAAGVALRSARIVLIEGNYLLLDAEPWAGLLRRFDMTAMTLCDRATVEKRLSARWRHLGLPDDECARRVRENDLPNAETVMTGSVAPGCLVATG